MSMIHRLVPLLAKAPSVLVSPSTADVSMGIFGATAYAGVQYRSDGTEFVTHNNNGSSAYSVARDDWLDRGLNSQVWVEWIRTGGTLGDWNSQDDGDTRLAMTATRAWRITRVASGEDTIIGRHDFYDAASGGNLIGSSGNRTFRAENIL